MDLPYPLRRLSLNPLGTLRGQTDPRRVIPSVVARMPCRLSVLRFDCLLRRSSGRSLNPGERRRVRLGTSPLAGDAEVCVDPNRLFGRHLAVLGNTGSGKSCSVAGLIRWSLEQAQQARLGDRPNARFIVLDPNGEYSRAFGHDVDAVSGSNIQGEPRRRRGCAQGAALVLEQRRVVLVHAGERANAAADADSCVSICPRRPKAQPTADPGHEMRRFSSDARDDLSAIEQNAGSPWGAFPRPKSFFEKLEKWESRAGA